MQGGREHLDIVQMVIYYAIWLLTLIIFLADLRFFPKKNPPNLSATGNAGNGWWHWWWRRWRTREGWIVGGGQARRWVLPQSFGTSHHNHLHFILALGCHSAPHLLSALVSLRLEGGDFGRAHPLPGRPWCLLCRAPCQLFAFIFETCWFKNGIETLISKCAFLGGISPCS